MLLASWLRRQLTKPSEKKCSGFSPQVLSEQITKSSLSWVLEEPGQDLVAGPSHRSDCHGDLSPCQDCFFRGFLDGQALTMQPHAALKQDDDSQEWVPSVLSSQNCHECTLKNMVRADSGEICPHAEVQLCNMDIEGTSCHCLLANCSTAEVRLLGELRAAVVYTAVFWGRGVILPSWCECEHGHEKGGNLVMKSSTNPLWGVVSGECLIGMCEPLQTFLKSASAEGLISQVMQSL